LQKDVSGMQYESAVQSTWRHSETRLSGEASLLKEMVRDATLAPSGHNTKCWRFRIENRAIAILPDFSRRTPVVDPDDHHLYVSLGCAAENLALAAGAYGYMCNSECNIASDEAIKVAL
jgi:nitroreductase